MTLVLPPILYYSRPRLHQIDDTIALNRHILLGDHLDHFLRNEPPKESSCVWQIGRRRPSPAPFIISRDMM